jgi:hypothetical protein
LQVPAADVRLQAVASAEEPADSSDEQRAATAEHYGRVDPAGDGEVPYARASGGRYDVTFAFGEHDRGIVVRDEDGATPSGDFDRSRDFDGTRVRGISRELVRSCEK